MSKEDFLVQKEAVYTRLAHKDVSLQEENERFYGEIAAHKYNFERQ